MATCIEQASRSAHASHMQVYTHSALHNTLYPLKADPHLRCSSGAVGPQIPKDVWSLFRNIIPGHWGLSHNPMSRIRTSLSLKGPWKRWESESGQRVFLFLLFFSFFFKDTVFHVCHVEKKDLIEPVDPTLCNTHRPNPFPRSEQGQGHRHT